MSYVVANLDELAELFEKRAEIEETQAEISLSVWSQRSLIAQADTWRTAAYIVRRTTIKEPG